MLRCARTGRAWPRIPRHITPAVYCAPSLAGQVAKLDPRSGCGTSSAHHTPTLLPTRCSHCTHTPHCRHLTCGAGRDKPSWAFCVCTADLLPTAHLPQEPHCNPTHYHTCHSRHTTPSPHPLPHCYSPHFYNMTLCTFGHFGLPFSLKLMLVSIPHFEPSGKRHIWDCPIHLPHTTPTPTTPPHPHPFPRSCYRTCMQFARLYLIHSNSISLWQHALCLLLPRLCLPYPPHFTALPPHAAAILQPPRCCAHMPLLAA